MTEIILLERIKSLGQMGDVVKVRPGFARNYLLPQKKALRATPANIEEFKKKKAHLEATHLNKKSEAEAVFAKLNNVSIVIVRAASETGHLYGSIRPQDIVQELEAQGFTVHKNQIVIKNPIKLLGVHDIEVRLHPDVSACVHISVVKSKESIQESETEEDVIPLLAFEEMKDF